jgi:hypothetical protein
MGAGTIVASIDAELTELAEGADTRSPLQF